jgi:hypothetical protein
MLNSMLAVTAAGACAAMIVGYVPDPISAVAAGLQTNTSAPTTEAARAADGHKGACAQSWPYYEQPCLHDVRKTSGDAHAVRVIAIERHPRGRAWQQAQR